MAEAIVIPSPTAFLRSSPAPPSPPDAQHVRPANAEGKKKAAVRKGGVGAGGSGDGNGAKPKQSKSRNGICNVRMVYAMLDGEGADRVANRLRDVQSETIEMRRGEAGLPAM